MHVVGLQLHQGERLILYLCLLALLTAVSVPKLSSLASLSVRRHETVLPLSFQQLKKKHSSRLESKQQELIPAVSALKPNRQQNRSADRPPSPQPTAKAQLADLKQHWDLRERRPRLDSAQPKSDKHLFNLPGAAPPLRISFRPGRPNAPEACIIPDVCLAYSYNEQRTFIPDIYRPHEAMLHRCTQNRPGLQFYSRSKPSPELKAALQRLHAFDLIGVPLTSGYWQHFPHWVLEYIKHIAVPASLFLRPQPPTARWKCSAPGVGALVPCSGRPPQMSPKLVLSELGVGKDGGWIRTFLRLLHTRDSVWLPGETIPKKPPLRCFRSLLVSPLAYDTSEERRDAFLRGAGVSRKKIATCRPRIVVIARSAKDKLDRTIPESSIRQLTEELSKQMPSATVELLRGLGGMSLLQQRELFQRTDVLVTVHGAEMANLIFAKRGASVVEIFPFAYYFSFFRPMIESVGAEHVRIVAKPDAERFLHCLENRARRELPDMRDAERKSIEKEFFDKEAAFERARTEERRNKAGMYISESFPFRLCSRAQRIAIDPVKIAAVVVKEARRKCGATGSV